MNARSKITNLVFGLDEAFQQCWEIEMHCIWIVCN